MSFIFKNESIALINIGLLISQDLHSGGPKAQQTKKTLTLKEKVDVIKYKDKSGCGSRSLAEKFVGKTKKNFLKNRDKTLREFETNEPSSKQRSAHKTGNEEINKLIWE